MHNKQDEKTFLHHAYAIGLGGYLERPFREPIESQAATALASSGGFGQSCVRDFCYRGLIRFDVARTFVTGSVTKRDGKRVWDTLVSASVENLSILDHVIADRITGHIGSRYTEGEPTPVTTSIRAQFHGLRIGGRAREFSLDINEFNQSREPAACKPDVNAIPVSPANLQVFEVPNLGFVYVAEHMDTPEVRQLTLLRLELGCPVEGGVTACQMASSGLPYPPEIPRKH